MPHLPIALANVVQNVNDIADLYPRLRVIALCDYTHRGAVDFASDCLNLFALADSTNYSLAVWLVYQRNPVIRNPVAIGAALKRTRTLVNVRSRWRRITRWRVLWPGP